MNLIFCILRCCGHVHITRRAAHVARGQQKMPRVVGSGVPYQKLILIWAPKSTTRPEPAYGTISGCFRKIETYGMSSIRNTIG